MRRQLRLMFYYENNMDKITQIIIEACFLDAPPNADDRLKEELGLDSLSLVTLLVRFENELEIDKRAKTNLVKGMMAFNKKPKK